MISTCPQFLSVVHARSGEKCLLATDNILSVAPSSSSRAVILKFKTAVLISSIVGSVTQDHFSGSLERFEEALAAEVISPGE